MSKLRAAFLAFIFLTFMSAPAALAQRTQDGFNVPDDVPLYVESFHGYEAGTTPNTLGDGSNARGGTMPVIAAQLDDIPTTPAIASQWKINTGITFLSIPPATEAKFRLQANICHLAKDDPIRNYRQPNGAHWHQFFGSCRTNHSSTFASLRHGSNTDAAKGRVATTISGGPLNASGYWFPPPIKTNPFGNGKDYAVKAYFITIYYQFSASVAATLSRLPRGARKVFGVDMDDPDGAQRAAEVAAANAQPGTSPTRYSLNTAPPYRNGFVGWQCYTSGGSLVTPTSGATIIGDSAKWLKSAGGVDPWNGACGAGGHLDAVMSSAPCYDGVNLWSPGGYKHFRYGIYDTVAGATVCPKGWYKVPVLTLKISFRHEGFADYGTWRLSSDDMMQAKLTSLGTPRTVANGESMHSDVLWAWDDTVMYGSSDGTIKGWLKACTGVDGDTPHECDSGTFNSTHHLRGSQGENSVDGLRNPQVNSSATQYDTDNASDMFLLPADPDGPHTIHSGGH